MYCLNNPIILTDPTGNGPEDDWQGVPRTGGVGSSKDPYECTTIEMRLPRSSKYDKEPYDIQKMGQRFFYDMGKLWPQWLKNFSSEDGAGYKFSHVLADGAMGMHPLVNMYSSATGKTWKGRQMSDLEQYFAFADAVMFGRATATKAAVSTAAEEVVEGVAKDATNAFSITKHGELTNGVYTVSKEAMKKHIFNLGQGKSIFYSTLNAEEAVLKAAQYADEVGLWIGNKAKVPVLNTNIGILGNGSPTNIINIYRNSNGFIHGSPGTIR